MTEGSTTGKKDLEWRLSNHLLKTFASMLDQISIEDVDVFRRAKVREGLSPRGVKKLLSTLNAILELACEYGHVQRNVAHGKRRRMKAEPTQRSYINRADHLAALLAGASILDADARLRPGQRRALLAVLAFAGLRHGEARSLRWGDINLAHGTISVRDGKTVTAARTVYIVPALRDELSAYKASVKPEQHELVFATAIGKALGASNIRAHPRSRDQACERAAREGQGATATRWSNSAEPTPNVCLTALRGRREPGPYKRAGSGTRTRR